MSRKLYYKVMAVLAVLICTADTVLAQNAYTFAQIKPYAIKIGIAMFAVMMFSILLTVGLSLYNKFFVASQIKDYKLSKDSLRTPADKDEAIMMYITKNRLK